jgi:flavin reductase (DIM6/NTAB) family NADH-FMN oxidoreductase RutF
MTTSALIDPRELRNALGRFATGVAVVTTRAAGGRPVGVTVNSMAAVSLEPPLVAWSLAARSGSLPAFLAAPCFAINVLAEDQEAVSRRFAGPAPERFAGLGWTPGLCGVPLLEGCLARFECRTARRIEAGDHWLLLGALERLAYGAGAPLVFFASRYGLPGRRLGDAVPASAAA